MVARAVARVDEKIGELEPKLVELDGEKKRTIGLYRFRGRYYAYENICEHQGGPVCEGEVMGKVECRVSASGRRLGDYTSSEKVALVCPWHGVEYDLETGLSWADSSLRLKSYAVRIEGENVVVEIPE
jgi:nitrite reductase (NADH) small subunit